MCPDWEFEPVTSWFNGRCSTTEPYMPNKPLHFLKETYVVCFHTHMQFSPISVVSQKVELNTKFSLSTECHPLQRLLQKTNWSPHIRSNLPSIYFTTLLQSTEEIVLKMRIWYSTINGFLESLSDTIKSLIKTLITWLYSSLSCSPQAYAHLVLWVCLYRTPHSPGILLPS